MPRMPRDGEPIPAGLGLKCLNCQYNLTGLISRVCPECGQAFDPREVFLALREQSWQDHFEYRRTKTEYVRYAIAGVFIALALCMIVPLTLGFGGPLVALLWGVLTVPVTLFAYVYHRMLDWSGSKTALAVGVIWILLAALILRLAY